MSTLLCFVVLLFSSLQRFFRGELTLGYYANSCPNAETIVYDNVTKHIRHVPSLAPALLPPILLLFTIASLPLSISGRTIRKAPAIFVFGDSFADVRNNNHFNTSQANFPHNGIDFPGSIPTGRFSNGYNTIDWIAKHVGYKQSPPAYMSVTEGKQMLRGVNFASGGFGILDTTGKTITFTTQLTDFMNAINELEKEVGKGYLAELIKQSLVLISAGSTDMFSYYLETGAQNATMNKQFIVGLVNKYADEIKDGLGDTISVSLTEPPEDEIVLSRKLANLVMCRMDTSDLFPCFGRQEAVHSYVVSESNAIVYLMFGGLVLMVGIED